MANTSTRMLRLLSLLQTHRYWTGSELADRLEVSERTRPARRRPASGAGLSGQRKPGRRAAATSSRRAAALPPLLLDDDEAVAIAVGLHQAAGGAVKGIEETSVRALTKIIRMMPPRLRRRIDALGDYTVPAVLGGGPTVDAGRAHGIAQACRDDERLRFGYTARGRRSGDPARRAEPAGDGRAALVPRCLGRRSRRLADVPGRIRLTRPPRSTRYRFEPREVPAATRPRS